MDETHLETNDKLCRRTTEGYLPTIRKYSGGGTKDGSATGELHLARLVSKVGMEPKGKYKNVNRGLRR